MDMYFSLLPSWACTFFALIFSQSTPSWFMGSCMVMRNSDRELEINLMRFEHQHAKTLEQKKRRFDSEPLRVCLVDFLQRRKVSHEKKKRKIDGWILRVTSVFVFSMTSICWFSPDELDRYSAIVLECLCWVPGVSEGAGAAFLPLGTFSLKWKQTWTQT